MFNCQQCAESGHEVQAHHTVRILGGPLTHLCGFHTKQAQEKYPDGVRFYGGLVIPKPPVIDMEKDDED